MESAKSWRCVISNYSFLFLGLMLLAEILFLEVLWQRLVIVINSINVFWKH